MKVAVLAVIVALLLSAGAAYLVVNPGAAPAAAGASVSAQTSPIIFDTSRIVELLRALIAKTPASAPLPFTQSPSTTTIPFLPVATPATSTEEAAIVPPEKTAEPKSMPLTATETKLGLVLPSLRSAIVNIVCLPNKPGTGLRGISGTGVIIDPRGIILTVAHVAQYELLAAARPDLIACVVRTGSPAASAYIAKPVYVSSEWIDDHLKTISATESRGSGEGDYGLLAITNTASKTPLPSSFPFVPLSPNTPVKDDPVVIGSYGAEFLTSATIRSGIFPTLVFGSIHDRFTFDTETIDVISLGGGAAAQEGSSGGGAVNQSGQLVGLITTRSTADDLANRDLRAITITYLQRAFRAESGDTLSGYLEQSPNALVEEYSEQAENLAEKLIKANRIGD